jgi:D-alanyl-D-alanine dipeptidase
MIENVRMKPYQKIKIRECGEPLVAIPPSEFDLALPSAYVKCGADYQGKSPYYLRQGVLHNLRKAKEKLQEIQPDWQLKIFDAYRPINVQQHMVDYTFNSICLDRQLEPQQLTPEEKDRIHQEVYQIWAIPSDNPLTPPPHSTGAAIDLTLMTKKGQEIDMGGKIDDLPPNCYPDYYAHSDNPHEQEYHRHRSLLGQIMNYAGFRRHPHEWWHFSYGDQLWAWLENQEQPTSNTVAKYGRI